MSVLTAISAAVRLRRRWHSANWTHVVSMVAARMVQVRVLPFTFSAGSSCGLWPQAGTVAGGLAALAVAGGQQTGPQVAEFGSCHKKARRWASKVARSVGLGRESASRMQVGNPYTLKRNHALLFQQVCPSTSNASI